MNRLMPVVLALIAAFAMLASCVYVVDQRKYAIVFALGEIKEVVSQPGLHFKLPPPFQNVVYIDKTILTIDTPDVDRFITSEKKNVQVDTYVKWRIVDPKVFYVSVGGIESSAADRISRSLRDALNNEIAKRSVNDVIAGERDRVMTGIRERVNEDAKQIGAEVVDVRLKRVDFAKDIRDSVFRRMASERKSIANQRRSQGAAESEKIRADADRQREVILAEAYREAQKVKGEGEAKATEIYGSAFSQNPEFASFYRSMEAYRATFRTKQDVLVFDSSSDFFKHFRHGGGSGGGGGRTGK